MAVVDVLNSVGEKVTQVDLADTVFNVPVKSSVLHEVVKMQLACRRAGSAAVKHRSDVSGSRRKLFRQKEPAGLAGVILNPPCSGRGVVFRAGSQVICLPGSKKDKKARSKNGVEFQIAGKQSCRAGSP